MKIIKNEGQVFLINYFANLYIYFLVDCAYKKFIPTKNDEKQIWNIYKKYILSKENKIGYQGIVITIIKLLLLLRLRFLVIISWKFYKLVK